MATLQAHFFSQCLLRNVTVQVVLPVDGANPPSDSAPAPGPWRTLYLLHGIFGNCNSWIQGSRIASWAMQKGLAVVMPSGENSFYVDHPSGDRYGEFIGVELPTLCERMFHLSTRRKDRYIAGLSMGGYGAVRNGLKYADRFSHVAGLSSALILDGVPGSVEDSPSPIGKRSYYESVFGDLDQVLGSDMDYQALIRRLQSDRQEIPRLYLACGTEDFLITQNRDYHRFLVDAGVPVTYEEGPGGHDWLFWDTYIQHVLEWLE